MNSSHLYQLITNLYKTTKVSSLLYSTYFFSNAPLQVQFTLIIIHSLAMLFMLAMLLMFLLDQSCWMVITMMYRHHPNCILCVLCICMWLRRTS